MPNSMFQQKISSWQWCLAAVVSSLPIEINMFMEEWKETAVSRSFCLHLLLFIEVNRYTLYGKVDVKHIYVICVI